MPKVTSFVCMANGKKYRLLGQFISCEMKNLIYMIEININGFTAQYVGLTIQEVWKRIYQHLSLSYNKFLRGKIQDKDDRTLADELASYFQGLESTLQDNETSQRKKKLFIQLLSKHVRVFLLAYVNDPSSHEQSKVKLMLQKLETKYIDLFDTLEHGANKISGADVNIADVEMDITENFVEET